MDDKDEGGRREGMMVNLQHGNKGCGRLLSSYTLQLPGRLLLDPVRIRLTRAPPPTILDPPHFCIHHCPVDADGVADGQGMAWEEGVRQAPL